MRFVPRLVVASLGLLCIGFLIAPTAGAAPIAWNEDHPSSDAPWLIGLLVLILLGGAMLMLLLRRGISKRSKSGDFR